MAKAYSIQEIVEMIPGADGRAMRKYLRKVTPKDAQPGKGSRWSIESAKIASIKKGFAEFIAKSNEDSE